jgi:DsbE subfamily thiol:disulfide oxidoreductase
VIKKAISAGILAGLILFAIFQQFNKEELTESVAVTKTTSAIEIGSVAPAFTLKDLTGREVKLEDYKGKKVMLNFWATWCPPCKAEMPAMQELYQTKSSEIEILAVNLDPQNNVAIFVNENGLTFPILLDHNGETQQTYSIISIPSTFIIDENGVIQKKHIGSMTFEQMEEIIK